MNEKDKALYDFLTENAKDITDKWLSKREKIEGSIYSADIEQEIENMLREQNSFTIKTIVSSLLPDKEHLRENVDSWAKTVAESRVDSDTPIFEVIEAVNKVQETIMDFVTVYIEENESFLSKMDVMRWNSLINGAFNELITSFSEVYYRITKDRLFTQQELINELSTPVIPISDAFAIVPLTGQFDINRTDRIFESIPKKCVDAGVEHLFIDLSGMPVIDTMVTHQVFQLIQILELLGITSTLSGIRPEVAQTAVQLGIDMKNIRTFSSLNQALSVIAPE
ncbi:STAS domain-containing protein [Sediminibacillus massiliensis]|uniref:STAS domain-containing protein n=1 Tax=Sediminibacillus massiliensis TaxID=1926277 RepID=UPI0009882FE3|nr:STAS domain-containing protein [Sediminibacillus massiliensis]